MHAPAKDGRRSRVDVPVDLEEIATEESAAYLEKLFCAKTEEEMVLDHTDGGIIVMNSRGERLRRMMATGPRVIVDWPLAAVLT